MYELKYEFDSKTNVYSSFACTCDKQKELDYVNELIKILSEEFNTSTHILLDIDDVYKCFGYNLFSALTSTLDDKNYGITGIITDMWSGMNLSHVYRPNNFPKLYVQYDQFIFGFVDAYHLAKLAVSSVKPNELAFDGMVIENINVPATPNPPQIDPSDVQEDWDDTNCFPTCLRD